MSWRIYQQLWRYLQHKIGCHWHHLVAAARADRFLSKNQASKQKVKHNMWKHKVIRSNPPTIRGTLYLFCLISANLMVVLLLDDATDRCVNKADNYVIQTSFGYIILQNKRTLQHLLLLAIHWQLDQDDYLYFIYFCCDVSLKSPQNLQWVLKIFHLSHFRLKQQSVLFRPRHWCYEKLLWCNTYQPPWRFRNKEQPRNQDWTR